MNTVLQDRVRRGIALLDQAGPEGWRGMITLEFLSTANLRRCVLGQVYGEYSDGAYELGLDGYSRFEQAIAARHGFDIGGRDAGVVGYRYADLDRAWKLELAAYDVEG